MKFLFILFLAITTAYAYIINQLPYIKGRVRQIEFDSQSNTYIDSYGGSDDGLDRLYKLNSANGIIFTQDFWFIRKILVNSKDDLYVIGSEVDNDGIQERYGVWRLKSNSNESELLFKFHWTTYADYFVDGDDNIFLNTRSGVAILRSRLNYPLAVAGLNGFNYDNHVIDDWGNVYLSNSDLRSSSVAIVTNYGKEQQVPEGDVYPIADTSRVSQIVLWDGQVVVVENPGDNLSTIKRLGLTALISRYDVIYTLYNSNNRLFFIEKDNVTDEANKLYFIDRDYGVVDLKEILNPFILDYGGIYAVDSNGTAFFHYFDPYNIRNHQLLKIRYDSNEIQHIVTPSKEPVASLAVDDEDGVWILAGDNSLGNLYQLPAGSEEASLTSIPNAVITGDSFLKYKKSTNELFIVTHNGVYVGSPD